MPEGTRFTASLDRTARVSTIVFSLLLLVAEIVYVRVLLGTQMPPLAYLLVVSLVLIWLLCLGFAPIGYQLTPDAFIVIRRFGNRQYPRTSIRIAEPITGKEIRWSFRTFGVGGLFGYFGKFSHRKLGAMTWYLTRRDRIVLLRLENGRKILVSPDEPEAFRDVLGV